MTFRFIDEALAEFIAAGHYYNRQVPGLGEAFIDEIEAGIEVILQNPTVWRVVRDDVRRYLIRRFPYGIYYTIENGVVVIWAIMHLHRAEDYWRTRRNG